MVTIHLPMWALWLVPVLIGWAVGLVGSRERHRVHQTFGLPNETELVGCGIVAATALIAAGFCLARLVR